MVNPCKYPTCYQTVVPVVGTCCGHIHHIVCYRKSLHYGTPNWVVLQWYWIMESFIVTSRGISYFHFLTGLWLSQWYCDTFRGLSWLTVGSLRMVNSYGIHYFTFWWGYYSETLLSIVTSHGISYCHFLVRLSLWEVCVDFLWNLLIKFS